MSITILYSPSRKAAFDWGVTYTTAGTYRSIMQCLADCAESASETTLPKSGFSPVEQWQLAFNWLAG
jgi:hypothetical protein